MDTYNRMSTSRLLQLVPLQSNVFAGANPGLSTYALDSAYTYGSAGDAYMFNFVPETSGNLTDLWLYVYGYTGSWASTDGVIDVEIREGMNGSRIPGTTLTTSFTVTLDGTTTGWIKVSGLSIALTAYKVYCIVVADKSGGGTNYVTMGRNASGYSTAAPVNISSACYSTGGFASAGTSTSAMACVAFKYDGRMHGGAIFTAFNTITAGTYARGNIITPNEPMNLVGGQWVYDNSAIFSGGTFKLFGGSTVASGSPLASWTIPSTTLNSASADLPYVILFDPATYYTLNAGTTYKFVIVPASSASTPRKLTQPANSDSDLRSLVPLSAYFCYDNSDTWVTDADSLLLLVPIVIPVASSGGSTPRFGDRTGGK